MTESPSFIDVASSFVYAVAWGEHRTVWALLGVDARHTVLQVALGRGMDDVLANRLRVESAAPDEYDEFLTDLVNGLRSDLAGADLDEPVLEVIDDDSANGHAVVVLATTTPAELAEHGISNLPVATIDLVLERDGWKVARVDPRSSR